MLILAAILAIFVYGLIAPMLGALLPTYSLTPDQQGTLGLSQALGLVIASLSAGPIIDVKGHKIGLVSGLSLVALSLFAAPNAGSYSGLLMVYFLLGIGGGITVTGANALAGSVDETRRGTTLNFLNLFFGLGGIVTTYAGSGVLSPVSLCYTVAGLTVVAVLVNVATKMPAPSGVSSFKLSEASALITQPKLILLSLFLFLYVACEVGVWNWLKTYLIGDLHMDGSQAGKIVSYGFAFGILVGRVVVSRILVKVPALSVTLVSAILMAVTTYAMLHATTSTSVAVAVFCAGLAMAPVFPTTLAMVGDAFPRGTASAMGIAITFGWIGLAVSSPIIGRINTASTLQNALLLLPIFSIAMVVVNFLLRPMLNKSVPASV